MSRQRALILALVAAFLLAAGCAFADETTEGTDPRNIEVQFICKSYIPMPELQPRKSSDLLV